jgi:valyl-tRNA synthetase
MTADKGRALRGEVKLPPKQKVPFYLVNNGLINERHPLADDQKAVLAAFLNASEIHVLTLPPSDPGPRTDTQLGDLYLPATGLVDPALEKDRLTKELAKVEKDLEQTRRKLADVNMLAKAPPEKVGQWRAHEFYLTKQEAALRESLAKLE